MAPRPSPVWLPALAALIAAALLALLALYGIAAGERLDLELKRARVEAALQQRLLPPLRAADAAALRQQTAALVADPALGLTYLAVNTAGGPALATAGRFEDPPQRRLPQGLLAPLRGAQYHRRRLQEAGVPLGEVEYAIAPRLAADVHDPAVARLRGLGAAALLLSVLAFAAAVLARRRAAPRPALAWLQRLDPPRPTTPAWPLSAPDAEACAARALYQRDGALLDELGRGVIVVDREAQLRYLNATAERLTGWSLADVEGRPVYSVFHPLDERRVPLLTPAEACLRDGRPYPAAELRLRARDGRQRPIEVMAAPLGSGGAPEGAIMIFSDISERENRIEQWRRQARLSQAVLDHLVEGVITTDPAGVIRSANARALSLFGYDRDELVGVPVTKLMPVPFLNSPAVRLVDYAGAERRAGLPRVVGWRRDATTFPVELVVQPMTVEQSEGLLVIVRDITERLRSENLAQRLGRLLDAATEEVYIFDAQSLYFVEVNRGARRNLGYHASEMTRMTPLMISEELDAESFHSYLARLRSGEAEHVTYRCKHRRADGTQYPVEVRLNLSHEEAPPVFMAIAVDITERDAAEQRLRYLAHHDALTGLPNRATLQDRLRQAILAASRSSRQVAVLFMDVDRFKHYNDTYGHELGDAVLRQVAQRLSELLRASDTVARLGGDEFVVVATGLHGIDDAVALARRIEQTFETPLELPGQALQITLSIGIAIYPLDESDADGLLHHADTAMYQAKQAGRGQYRLYGIDVPPAKRRRLDLERGIHAAVALNQFRLELMPVFGADRRSVHAALAQLYWQHPVHGRVEPDETLASANRAGLRADVELLTLYSATSPAPNGRPQPLSLIVAVSGWQLRNRDFGAHVADLIVRNGLPPERLIIASDGEGLLEARHGAYETLHRLYGHGVRLALHDHADALCAALDRGGLPPFDLIVLDAAQVARLPGDEGQAEALRRALAAVHAGGHTVLAPAVESEHAFEWLRVQGCTLFAGSALQRPLAPAAFTDWLARRTVEPL